MNSKTVVIRDLEFHWPHLVKSHSPFGAEIWDIQVRTTDDNVAKQLSDAGVSIKIDPEGFFKGNVKRKTVSAKGDPLKAPLVLGADKMPLDNPEAVGNGSKGAVKLFSYEYSTPARSGTAAMLVAILVEDLVEYTSAGNPDDEDF